MNGKSLNILQDNLDKLREIFPDIFSEGKIDIEKFKAAFTDDINFNNERYVLNWAGKADAFKTLQTPTIATLKPIPEESIDFDITQNVFIEGENLEVLKVLQKSYYGKVKCIIIDPPYNTGNDSFVYPDNFKETKAEYEKRVGDKNEDGLLMKDGQFRKNSKDSGHFHSNWLSMMYPRLFLAKNLLKDDGVIFVHIDDNEVHNLRLLMNEVFGEENFISQIIWQRAYAPVNMNRHFSPNHDYIICYSKNIASYNLVKLPRTDKQNNDYQNPDNDPRGKWKAGNPSVGPAVEKNIYPITMPSGRVVTPPKGRSWLYSEKRYLELVADNRIYYGKDGNSIWAPKLFLSEVSSGVTPLTLWTYQEVGHSQDATKELKKLFDDNSYFDYPKPVKLIKRLVHLGTKKNVDLVLDFFAGSATTAQAVLELNKEDNGNRKFILVQLPELCDENSDAFKEGYRTIADISKERIRRVIHKLENEQKENKDKRASELSFDNEPGHTNDFGFKVFKAAPSNFKIWRGDEISEDNILTQLEAFSDPLKGESKTENILFELLLKAGYSLTENIIKKQGYYVVKDSELIMALEKINQSTVENIISEHPKKVIVLDQLFAGNDQLKTNTVLQMRDAGIDFKTI